MDRIKDKILSNKLFSFLILALFFSLPFERIPTFEFSGFTIKISYIIFLVIIALLFFNRPKLSKFSSEETVLFFLLIAALVSTLLFSSNKTRGMITLLMWAFVFILYYLLPKLIRKYQIKFEVIEKVIIWSAVITSIFGLFQFIGDSFGLRENITLLTHPYTKEILGFPRAQSVGLEPLYFANFLLVPIYLAIAKYRERKNFLNIYWIISIVLLITFILTVSRGAYIALSVTGFLYLIYLLINKNYIKILGFISIVILSIGISFMMIKFMNGTSASKGAVNHSVVYFTETNTDGSALDRLGTYKLAFEQFKKNPIIGNGLASFGENVTPQSRKDIGIYQTVNNEYLELLAENGLIGFVLLFAFLALYLIFLYKFYRTANNSQKAVVVAMFLGLLAILIQYNFFSTLYIIYIWAFLALLKSYSFND